MTEPAKERTHKRHGEWNERTFPLSGWRLVGSPQDIDPRRIICQMCRVAPIRYVYKMEHVTGRELLAGVECAKDLHGVYQFAATIKAIKKEKQIGLRDPLLAAQLRADREALNAQIEAVVRAFRARYRSWSKVLEAYLWLESRVGTNWAIALAREYHPEWFGDEQRLALYRRLSEKYHVTLSKRGRDYADWLAIS